VDSLRDRVAVVTGGGSGIGRALVDVFARESARLVVADIDEAAATDAAETVRKAGGTAFAVRTDVSQRAEVRALADRAFAELGAVDVLCNNAGVALWGPLEAATHEDWQWALGVNLWGVIHGLEAFLPRMIASGRRGHVVNTASMAGLLATPGLGVYNTSKYAVVGLSETLVKDLAPHGIGVSVLCPLGVATRIRTSDRNRPTHLRNAEAHAAAPVALDGSILAPEAVAELVLSAILENRLYVITHPEALEPIRRRFQRIERAVLEQKPRPR
jgi:NAD(P)-dependent dehydrogenase (short-subunit alcohol dehydrogenase family)